MELTQREVKGVLRTTRTLICSAMLFLPFHADTLFHYVSLTCINIDHKTQLGRIRQNRMFK